MKSYSLMLRSNERRWLALRLAAAGLWVAAGQAVAQGPDGNASPACVDARVGTTESYNCLNRDLQKQVARPHQGGADVSIDAMSPAPQVGTYNQAAVREHLGNNFGKSAVPQRPSVPVFVSPLVQGH
jgi:hypothetical protein